MAGLTHVYDDSMSYVNPRSLDIDSSEGIALVQVQQQSTISSFDSKFGRTIKLSTGLVSCYDARTYICIELVSDSKALARLYISQVVNAQNLI